MQAKQPITDRPSAESGKGRQAEIIINGTPNTAPAALVSSETGLACLFRMGVQNGVYAEIGAVRRRNLIDGERMPVAQLAESPASSASKPGSGISTGRAFSQPRSATRSK
jgi:hypothetical protein